MINIEQMDQSVYQPKQQALSVPQNVMFSDDNQFPSPRQQENSSQQSARNNKGVKTALFSALFAQEQSDRDSSAGSAKRRESVSGSKKDQKVNFNSAKAQNLIYSGANRSPQPVYIDKHSKKKKSDELEISIVGSINKIHENQASTRMAKESDWFSPAVGLEQSPDGNW